MKFLIELNVTPQGTYSNVLKDEQIALYNTEEGSKRSTATAYSVQGVKGFTGALDFIVDAVKREVDDSGIKNIVGNTLNQGAGVADCDLHSLSDEHLLLEAVGRTLEHLFGGREQSIQLELRRRAKLRSR